MLVLVSGPDKTGKTTLVKGLVEEYNAVHIKCSNEKREIKEFMTEFLIDTFECNKDTLFICDRFYPIDDPIYEPIVAGRESIFTYEDVVQYELQLNKIPTLLLLTNASTNVIKTRYDNMGGDEYLPLTEVPKIQDGYGRLARGTLLPTITINSTDTTVEEDRCNAIEKINLWLDHCQPPESDK